MQHPFTFIFNEFKNATYSLKYIGCSIQVVCAWPSGADPGFEFRAGVN